MEFIKIARRRSFLSSSLHVLLNILLVACIWASIIITNSPYVAIVLILISKWRVFAVRPRFWLANVKSNLVDLIICLGLALIMWLSGEQNIIFQSVISLIYAVWLLLIKPRSEKLFVEIQAIMAVFIGFFALFSISYSWPLVLVVVCGWLIGYSSIRHILSTGDNPNFELLSMTWGLIIAELSWIFTHWTIGYNIFGPQNIMLPQPAIITSVLSFLVFSLYNAYKDDKKINIQEIVLPIIFSIVVCFVLIMFFSGVPQI